MILSNLKAYLVIIIPKQENFDLVQNHPIMDFDVIIFAFFQIAFYIPIFIAKCKDS
jgi:hypothetical protein